MRQLGVQISAPVLVSTTNVQTLNTRDVSQKQHTLRKVSSVSSHSSANSDGHSDHSSIPSRSRGASFTDNSSVGSSPSSPKTDNANLWDSSPRKAKSTADLRERARTEVTHNIPPIPRTLTTLQPRTKTPVVRKQSLQSTPSPAWPTKQPTALPVYRQIPKSVPETGDLRQRAQENVTQSRPIGSPHPFSKELRQLDQVAEEYRDAAMQEDMEVMASRGLFRFCADDYMRDLQPLFCHYFMPQPVSVGWI